MTNSQIFATAHKIAKNTVAAVGNYLIAFSFALKEVYASLKVKAAPKKGVITAIENGFFLEYRGNKMTLQFCKILNCWEMFNENASSVAHRTFGYSAYSSLKEVENKYKSWKGISLLAAGTASTAN